MHVLLSSAKKLRFRAKKSRVAQDAKMLARDHKACQSLSF
jgi:hypothetical protein